MVRTSGCVPNPRLGCSRGRLSFDSSSVQQGVAVAWLGLALLILAGMPSRGTAGGPSSVDLGEMPLDQLLSLEVTSVSKQPEQLQDAAAAVFVLTREDILRSGYTTIPDLLRLVPGMQVGQLSSGLYAVSARGMASRFARDLLVLVDGRSIFTPMFSGVYWESQDLPLEDIERIEVIRGPGATMWGANAVNGVINIITRKPVDTQGGYVHAGRGSREDGLVALRYGGRLGINAHYRAWWKGFRRSTTETDDGIDLRDDWNLGRGGVRIAWNRTPAQNLTLQCSMHRGDLGLRYELPTLQVPYRSYWCATSKLSGEYALANWRQSFGDEAELSIQSYIDHDMNGDPAYSDERTTIDLEVQHRFAPGSRLGVIWGADYRRVEVALKGSDYIRFRDSLGHVTEELRSVFVQNEIEILRDRLQLTAGCKLESKTGLEAELQPNIRLAWRPSSRQTVWGAASRAVRHPSIAEEYASIWIGTLPPDPDASMPLPVVLSFEGSPDLRTEVLHAWEAGYRVQASNTITFDLALFRMEYHDVRGVSSGEGILLMEPAPHIWVPLKLENLQDGSGQGVEGAIDCFVHPRLRLRAAYSHLELKKDRSDGADSPTAFSEFRGPTHQGVCRASVDLGRAWQVDVIGRYVDEIPGMAIDSYFVTDASVAWRPLKPLELRLTGTSLGHPGHEEFLYELDDETRVQIRPAVYTGVTWTF